MDVIEKYFSHKAATAELYIWDSSQATLSALYCYDRGKGYAKALMTEICNFADDRKLSLILAVSPYGHIRPRLEEFELIEFYKKFGFVVDEEIHGTDMTRYPR
jgi:hypothetical protein